MPWHVARRDSCPAAKPWALVREAMAGKPERVVACHVTREDAERHMRASYANEPGAGRSHLLARTEWKAAAGSPGELEGYASVFGNVDQGGDVVLPGAFRKTLADWSRSKLPMPLIADHDLSTEGVIGSVKDAREDGFGLRVRAGFSATAKAQDIRTKMIEGHLGGMSFTYDAVKHYMGTVAGKSVRYLQELKLFEATVTPFPMNTLATASAKADSTKPYGDVAYADPGYQSDGKKRYPLDTEAHCRAAWSYISMPKNASAYTADQLALIKGRIRAALKKYGVTVSESASLDFTAFSDAMRAALGIGFEPAAKAAADLLVAAYQPLDDAAGPADGQPTADAAAGDGTAESTADDPAAYAYAVITPPGPPDGAPGGEPPKALAGPLAQLEMDRAAQDMDRLEAELQGGIT